MVFIVEVFRGLRKMMMKRRKKKGVGKEDGDEEEEEEGVGNGIHHRPSVGRSVTSIKQSAADQRTKNGKII
jgi:hypothetical protein